MKCGPAAGYSNSKDIVCCFNLKQCKREWLADALEHIISTNGRIDQQKIYIINVLLRENETINENLQIPSTKESYKTGKHHYA